MFKLNKSIVKNIIHWIKAFRLRTLPLSLSCILVGSGLAVIDNKFSWSILILAIITTTLLQVLSNIANDYGDTIKGTDNDNRVGPERALQSGKITRSQMKKAIIINSILALFSGLILISTAFDRENFITILFFIVLGVAAIAAAIKYTMGKNPYGYSGMGDLFVFLFFGLIGVMGTHYLHTNIFDIKALFPSVAIGLLSAAVLNMNNMRDEENDKECNKNTLVVKIGARNAKIYHSFLIGLAFIMLLVTLTIFDLPLISYLSTLPFIVLFKNIYTVWKNKIKAELDPELKKIALSTFFISFILTASIFINQL